jgi:glycosyltransferase involved in cell wall biosynthesis
MRVSGITIAYQAESNGYPVAESIRSMLPLCDEVVVNVGQSDDGTRAAVLAIASPKIRLLDEPWDLDQRTKGLLLSRETNRAMDAATGDWVVYLQADEVLHERDLPSLAASIARASDGAGIDGLSLRYLHFYGSPAWVQDHPFKWYRRAVRVVRRDPAIRSVGDALKFRRFVGGAPVRLRTLRTGIPVYHYGWARPPDVMLRKQRHFDRFWHGDEALRRKYAAMSAEHIYDDLGHLRRFLGDHPAVMRDRVAAATWAFNPGVERQLPRWMRLAVLAVSWPLTRAVAKLAGRWAARRKHGGPNAEPPPSDEGAAG